MDAGTPHNNPVFHTDNADWADFEVRGLWHRRPHAANCEEKSVNGGAVKPLIIVNRLLARLGTAAGGKSNTTKNRVP